MDGREFLGTARRLVQSPIEADWRAAAGRSYYALLHEGLAALQRWGFVMPPRDPVHSFVRLRFVFAQDRDLKVVGYALEELVRLRNQADYRLEKPGPFADAIPTQQAIGTAQNSIDILDQIEVDSNRRAAAIAAIRAAYP
jgi:hypothetical protein